VKQHGSVAPACARSKALDKHVDQLRHGHRGPIITDRPPGPHHGPMAPVDIPEPFIEPTSVDVGQPDAQGKLLVTQPADGVLTRLDQGCADAAPLQQPHDLQVMELRDAGKVAADLGHVGWPTQQVHITHGTVTQPGDEQHATPLVLASQAVSEERALPKCFHQRGKLGISGRPDLYPRTHRAQPNQPVAPVHRFAARHAASGDRQTWHGDHDQGDAQPVASSTDAAGRDAKHACVPLRRVRAGEVRCEEVLYE
jgi:hypothetical protein